MPGSYKRFDNFFLETIFVDPRIRNDSQAARPAGIRAASAHAPTRLALVLYYPKSAQGPLLSQIALETAYAGAKSTVQFLMLEKWSQFVPYTYPTTVFQITFLFLFSAQWVADQVRYRYLSSKRQNITKSSIGYAIFIFH